MALTESQKASIKKYQQEKLEEIKFRVPKGEKAEIQAHAKMKGESTNAFIYRSIQETMERDRKENGDT